MSNLIISCVIKKSYWYVWITLSSTIRMICPRCSVQDEAEPTSAPWFAPRLFDPVAAFRSSLRSTKYLILAELEIIYGWSLYLKRPPRECMMSLRFTDTSTCVEWFDFPTSCKKLRKRQDDNNTVGVIEVTRCSTGGAVFIRPSFKASLMCWSYLSCFSSPPSKPDRGFSFLGSFLQSGDRGRFHCYSAPCALLWIWRTVQWPDGVGITARTWSELQSAVSAAP